MGLDRIPLLPRIPGFLALLLVTIPCSGYASKHGNHGNLFNVTLVIEEPGGTDLELLMTQLEDLLTEVSRELFRLTTIVKRPGSIYSVRFVLPEGMAPDGGDGPPAEPETQPHFSESLAPGIPGQSWTNDPTLGTISQGEGREDVGIRSRGESGGTGLNQPDKGGPVSGPQGAETTSWFPREETQAPAVGGTQAPGAGGSQAPAVGGSQAPAVGGSQAPSAGGTHDPSEEGTHTPVWERTQAPGGRETQAPSESETQAPSEGGTEPPDEGETQTTSGGRTLAPSGMETHAPDGGETPVPGGEGTQAPGGGGTQAPGGGGTQVPGGGETQTPGGRGTQTPGGGGTQIPSGEETQVPGGGGTLTPSGMETQAPGGGGNQAPGGNNQDSEYTQTQTVDIILDTSHPGLGNWPYTRHSGECAQKGEYIYITHDFLNRNPENITVRILTHEMLHYLFGVFDERLVVDGQSVPSCPWKAGRYPDNGSLEPASGVCKGAGCPPQTYMSDYSNWDGDPPGVCSCIDKSTPIRHNGADRTPHNLRCDYLAMADVLKKTLHRIPDWQSVDFVVPRAKRVSRSRTRTRHVVVMETAVVLNKTFSPVLQRSIQLYIERNVGNEIALVVFGAPDSVVNRSGSKVILHVTEITRHNTADLQEVVNNLEVSLNWTNFKSAKDVCIECGVKTGLQEISRLSCTARRSMTLITLGNESNGSLSVLSTDVTSQLSRFDAVVLTPDGNVRAILKSWAKSTQGEYTPYLTLHDTLPIRAHSDKYSDHPTCIQVRCQTLTCGIDRQPRSLTFVLDQRYLVMGVLILKHEGINVTDPVVSSTKGETLEGLIVTNRRHYSKIVYPRPVQASTWNLTFTPVFINPTSTPDTSSVKVKVLGRPGGSWKHTITLSASLSVTVIDFSDVFKAPKILADVSYGLLPICSPHMTVTAKIVLPSLAETLEVTLKDDGILADVMSQDGQYSAYIPQITLNGTYTVTVYAKSNGFNYSDKEILTASGTLRKSGRGDVMRIPAFERSSEPQFFTILNRPEKLDPIPPAKVVDLSVEANETLNFRFTPPGDDLEIGNADLCRIYYNQLPKPLLKKNYYAITDVLVSISRMDMVSAPGVQLVQLDEDRQRLLQLNGTYYFAVSCKDDDSPQGNWGPQSNIAAAIVQGFSGAGVLRVSHMADSVSGGLWVWILVGTLSALVALLCLTCLVVRVRKRYAISCRKRKMPARTDHIHKKDARASLTSVSSENKSNGSTETSSSGSSGPVVYENPINVELESGTMQPPPRYDRAEVNGIQNYDNSCQNRMCQRVLQALVSGGLGGLGPGEGNAANSTHHSSLELQGERSKEGHVAIHVYHHYPSGQPPGNLTLDPGNSGVVDQPCDEQICARGPMASSSRVIAVDGPQADSSTKERPPLERSTSRQLKAGSISGPDCDLSKVSLPGACNRQTITVQGTNTVPSTLADQPPSCSQEWSLHHTNGRCIPKRFHTDTFRRAGNKNHTLPR